VPALHAFSLGFEPRAQHFFKKKASQPFWKPSTFYEFGVECGELGGRAVISWMGISKQYKPLPLGHDGTSATTWSSGKPGVLKKVESGWQNKRQITMSAENLKCSHGPWEHVHKTGSKIIIKNIMNTVYFQKCVFVWQNVMHIQDPATKSGLPGCLLRSVSSWQHASVKNQPKRIEDSSSHQQIIRKASILCGFLLIHIFLYGGDSSKPCNC